MLRRSGAVFARAGERSPVAALLSWFVPFYLVYWLYRIHGEEAYVKPSRKLLSPRAAAWISVIPLVGDLLIPFMLSTLADHNNEVSEAPEALAFNARGRHSCGDCSFRRSQSESSRRS